MPSRNQIYGAGRPPLGDYPSGGGYDNGRLIDMIRSQGQQQAQYAQQKGDIWGNALQSAGQQIAGGLQAHQEEKKLKKRDAAWLAAVQDEGSWKDPATMAAKANAIWGPQLGPEQFKGAVAAHQLGQGKRDPVADGKALIEFGRSANRMSPEAREVAWPQIRALSRNAHPELPLPEQYDDDYWTEVIVPQLSDDKAKGEAFTLKPGEQRFGPDGKPVASVAPEAKEPTRETRGIDVQAADALARGDEATYTRLLKVKKEMGQADDRPRITLNTGAAMSPTAESNIMNRLSTQWDRASKTANELNRQASLMKTGLEAARKGDMAAGSQAVLVTFQKILDPVSVVRESEYARSASGQSLLNQMEGAYQRLVRGGAGVPLSELEQYSKLADQMVKASTGNLPAMRDRIGKTADRYRIPRELIIGEGDLNAGDGLANVSSLDDYNRVPSGAEYTDPKGVRRRKP